MSELGQISNVEVNEEEKKVFVDVVVSPSKFEEGIRFRTPGAGVWFIPEEDDIVEVKRINKNRAVAFSPYNIPEFDLPPSLTEGDIAFKLNEDTQFLFQKNQEENYDILLQTEGDIILDGNNVVTNQ